MGKTLAKQDFLIKDLAISIGAGGLLTVVNVEEARGRRPWTGHETRAWRPAARRPGPEQPRGSLHGPAETGRLESFAAPRALIESLSSAPPTPPADGRP